jgi:hypothetical protein
VKDRNSLNYLMPFDGASSSSSSHHTKKKEKKEKEKEDKKGKMAAKVTCKICDDGIFNLFTHLFLSYFKFNSLFYLLYFICNFLFLIFNF